MYGSSVRTSIALMPSVWNNWRRRSTAAARRCAYGLADGATGGVHHDVGSSLQVLQLKKAEAWQAEFTPVCDTNGNDIMTPVGNAQRCLVTRGQEV